MKHTIPPQTSAANVRQTSGLFPRSGMSALLKKMATVLVIAGTAGSALAANKFWGGPAGTGASPVSGTWDTSSLNWSATATGASSVAFVAADTANFGGVDGIYAIKVGGAISAASLVFNNSGYTLAGDTAQTVTSSGTTAITVANGKTNTVGNNVTVNLTANGANFNPGGLTGTLIIESGGKVIQPNALGLQIDGGPGSTIHVMTGGLLSHTGAGSAFRVGQTANSSPLISIEGGTVSVINSAAACVIGNAATATGTVTVVNGLFAVTNNSITIGNNATARGVINLEGGSVNARQLKKTSGTAIFNFNGGTLRAVSSALASTFMTGLDTANVRNGGANVDNGGFAITIGQALVHSTIAGDASTDGGLTSLGSGSLTLTGANTYNGPTVVSTGKLVTTTASTGAGAYTVADGGSLEVQVTAAGASLANSSLTLGTSGNVTNNFTLGANGSTTVPAVTVGGALNLNGVVNITVTGTGLTGPNTYLLMSYGSIAGTGSFVANTLPAISGFIATLTNDVTAKQLKLIYAQAPQSVKWAAGDGNWDITSLNWNLLSGVGPTNFVDGALTVFDDSATGSSPITVTLAGDRSPTSISNNAAKTYILAGSAAIAGGATITKNGIGTFVLDNSGANVLSAVAVNAGTLQLGNNDAGGSFGSATIANNGTLALTRTDNLTLNNILSGSGALVQSGSDNVTLGGASTFAGLTAINSGVLTVGNTGALQNSTVSNNVANGLAFANGVTVATLGGLAGAGDFSQVNAGSAVVAVTVGGNNQSSAYAGNISGGGNFLKAGTGTLALGGSSTVGNVQTTGAGTLIISGGTSTFSALQMVADNSVVQMTGGNVTVPSDCRINGSNCLMSISGGTLNLPKTTIGATATSSNSLIVVSGTAQVFQNSGGGTSPVNQLLIGGNNGGSGTLLLKDNAAWNNVATLANSVIVGNVNNGQGTLTIQDSATFYNATVMRVADLAGNGGTINLNGGICSVSGFSKGAGLGTVNVNGGQVIALAGSTGFFSGFTGTNGANAVNLVSGRLTFDNGGNTVTINNVLSGAGGLAAQGGGSLTLSAANTYTGNTAINAGTLVLAGAGSINNSSSISNNAAATLDVSAATAPLSINGMLALSDSTLIVSLLNTNATVGTFGTAGSANTVDITALPVISMLPTSLRVIKYTNAAAGLVDGGNYLTTLGVILPGTGSPQGYLTNNATGKSIDLVITNYLIGPTIASQPVPDSAYGGGKAHFAIQLVVTNLVGVNYQWRKAGAPLTDGATVSGSGTTTLRLGNIAAGDAVNYDVVITNTYGAVTSSPAALTYLTPTNYEAAAVAAGPAALYMFQETSDPSSGTATAFDYEGDQDGLYGVTAQNGFNGVTGPTPSVGFPGFDPATLAAHFSGFTSNSHVAIPPLNLNTNTVTLAAWINPGLPPANCGLMFCRGGGTVAGMNFTASLDANGNRTLGYTWNSEAGTFGWNSQIAPPPGIWSYVALVITPTNATVYIFNANGLLSASQAYTHVIQSFSASTWIGDDAFSAGNRQFDGSVYGAAIYGKSLSQSQLENMYGVASGVSNFPPVISNPPVSQNLYEQQTATFSAAASGSQPLSYQWQYFDGANYFNVVNGGRISGANAATLVISNLVVADATNFALVVTNFYGSATSSVVTLTVNLVGPAEAITNSTVLASGSDWNTGTAWSDGLSASVSALTKPGSTYYVVPGGGLRTPNVTTNALFPGNVLNVVGGTLILKGAGSSYAKLVMNGGGIQSFTDSNGNHIFGGNEVNVLASTPISGLSSTGGRSITINARLTGNGDVDYTGWANATFQPSAVTALNIAGTNNTYNGTWNVIAATLVGSASGALGTNTITVGAMGALQTTYDINNINGTLVLNGQMNLTRNDTFWSVSINGTNLNGGTYSYATLAAAYPANFPATWTGQTGVETATTASGSITVLASTIAPNPTPLVVSAVGGLLLLSWAPDHLGWIAQSNSVSLANTNFWIDIAGSQTATNLNITINPALPNVFYRLRHP